MEPDTRERAIIRVTRRRDETAWPPGVAIAVALTYITVAIVFFAAGYLISRFLI